MKKIILAIVVLGGVFVLSSVFTVDETKQVVILQFGKHVKTIIDPGIQFKTPFIQKKVVFDKRLLEYDSPPEEVLSKDKKTLIVDNYVRWRIADPLLFLKTVQATPTALNRLRAIVKSELRLEMGTHNMSEIITENREKIMEKVTAASNKSAKDYGIEVVDVRIKRVDLPRENEASIYARMDAERKRQADKFRSEGSEEAQKIRATTDKEKTIILADAYKQSEEIRGAGDAKAVEIYAQSYSKDPSFYEFLRTLEAYKKIVDKNTTLILSANSKLFKLLMEK